jgi:hypothetical protein
MNATTVKTRLARILSRNAVAVILPGQTASVDGTRCRLHSARIQGEPGYKTDYRGSVLIAVPTTLPTLRTLLRVDGAWYRLIGMEKDSMDAGIRLDLGEAKSEQ